MAENNEELKTMLRTIVDEQSSIRGRIERIDDKLEEMIRIEAELANNREGMQRMGGMIDKLEAKVETQDKIIVNMRIESARQYMKITLLGGGGGAGVAAVIGAVLKGLGLI
jgi:soluble cytochrome b562